VLAVFAAVLVPLSAAQGGAFSGDNGSVAFTCGANVCTNGAASPLLTGATDPSWSSDGSQIAFVDATNGVSVADADGANRQALGAGNSSAQPTYSANGLRVAYVKTGDLWSILANTLGQEQHLTATAATDADPAYSPDGGEIAFARDGGSGYDIWSLDLSDNSVQQITSAAGDERSPTWSPSGLTIVYTSSAYGHLFAVSASGGTPTDLNVAGTDPTYSPDGTKIAYIDAAGHVVSIPAAVSPTPTATTIDAGGTFSQPDWQSVAPPPPSGSGPPTNLSYPTINLATGDSSPVVGHFLTASVGSWDGSFPITYTYQWKRCDAADPVNGVCVEIPGATSSFYTPSNTDVGKRLRVQVKATNSQGSAAQNSEVSAPVIAIAPVNRATPQIQGGNVVDSPLSIVGGRWEGSTPIAFTYSWRRCNPVGDLDSCVQIPGATQATYTPAVADIGSSIRVWITGTNPAGSDVVITNHTFPIVDKAHFAPTASIPPAVAGTLRIGRQLTANSGVYDGDAPIRTVWQWQRCDATGAACRAIPKATKLVYFPRRGDVGYTLRIVVTATNEFGQLVSMSPPTEPVAADPPHRKGRRLIGTNRADYKGGGGYDDVIFGRAGNDTLRGGAGDDRIFGGPGYDVITGGSGADRLYGGPGSDTIDAADDERDVVDCGRGNDRVFADSFDMVSHCEVVSAPGAAPATKSR
jgi:hypothetical protein